MLPNFPKIISYRFLDITFDPENPDHVSRFIEYLMHNPPNDFRSAHHWFGLFNEGSIAISECQSKLELETYLDIDNKVAEKKIRQFDEKILSQLLLSRKALMETYMDSPWRGTMHSDDRNKVVSSFIYRQNYSHASLTDLQIKENELIRKYKKFMNTASVKYEGKNVAISSLVSLMSNATSEVRKKSFLAYWNYIYEHEQELQNIFTQILLNRNEQAKTLNISSYMPIAFSELNRMDYGASECAEFCNSIKAVIVPIVSELAELQKKSLQTTEIYPWDAGAWPDLTPTMEPSNGSIENIINGMGIIAESICPAFGKLFAQMRATGLINVDPYPNKAPGAFCVTFPESGMPYIFANFAGNFKDAFTLAHEFGHALHGHASSFVDNALLRSPGMEFSEFAAIGFEFLSLEHLEAWWKTPQDRQKAAALTLFGAMQFWPFMAMIDSWQHTIYETVNLSSSEARNSLWHKLSRQYRPHINWSGIEHLEPLGWFSRPHIFTSPFYYIDYGIAQLGAIQLLNKYKINKSEAINSYIYGLSLGAQRNLRELFAATDIKLDFSEELLTKLAQELKIIIKGASGG